MPETSSKKGYGTARRYNSTNAALITPTALTAAAVRETRRFRVLWVTGTAAVKVVMICATSSYHGSIQHDAGLKKKSWLKIFPNSAIPLCGESALSICTQEGSYSEEAVPPI